MVNYTHQSSTHKLIKLLYNIYIYLYMFLLTLTRSLLEICMYIVVWELCPSGVLWPLWLSKCKPYELPCSLALYIIITTKTHKTHYIALHINGFRSFIVHPNVCIYIYSRVFPFVRTLTTPSLLYILTELHMCLVVLHHKHTRTE